MESRLTMKKCFYGAVMSGMLVAYCGVARDLHSQQWGAMTNNVQMAISLKGGQKEIKTNQPLVLLIQIKNRSEKDNFVIYRRNWIEGDPGFSFAVLTPSGKDISPKPVVGGGSGMLATLAPSRTMEIEINLGARCRFSEAGSYRVVAKREVLDPRTKQAFRVVSNELQVPVVADK
jgi:hypothetical protein